MMPRPPASAALPQPPGITRAPAPWRLRPFASALLALGCAALVAGAAAQGSLFGGSDGSGGMSPIPGGGTGSLGGLFGGGGGSSGSGGMCKAPEGGATSSCGTGPASTGSGGSVDVGAGNPINITNGNKYQVEVDLPALPGELGIEIVRHYNSANRHVVGQLGMGWRLSYETDLYVVGQSVQILQADGRRLTFAIDPSHPSECAGADPAQGWVQIVADGRGRKEYVWHWTHGEGAGRRLRFDARGKLVQIQAASGAVLSITRGPRGQLVKVTDPQGRSLTFNHGGVASVRAAEQRRASERARENEGEGDGEGGEEHLAARDAGLAVFTGIHSIDTPVGRFAYTHGVQGEAARAQASELTRAQAANLTQVGLPTQLESGKPQHDWSSRVASSSSIRRQYHYEDARHPQALTGISVLGSGSDGQVLGERLSTYLYDARGRATLSVRGAPARLQADAGGQPLAPARLVPGTGVEQVHVQILEPALPTRAGRTLLTNSLGQQTLYTHRIVGGEYRLVEALGAGCASCAPVNRRWSYDGAGRLLAQTLLSPVAVKDGKPQGEPQPLLTTRHVPDARGRGLRIEQVAYVAGKAQAATLVERQEYADGRWPDKPTLVARQSVVAGREHQVRLAYNDAGQVTEFTETGYSPLTAEGAVAATAQQATALERTTAYGYERINGTSVLVRVDGPLANGPAGSPADSDVTTFQWDGRGSYITAIDMPGGLRSELGHAADSGLLERVVNDAGFATSYRYNPQLQPTRISSQGPGWSQPQVQSWQYDALGRAVQRFAGDAPAGADDAGAARATERQAFDAQGRLLWRASALGLLHTRRYDSEGQLIESALQSATMAKRLTMAYDAFGRPVASSDNAGRTQLLRYGADGRPEAYRDPLGRVLASTAAAAARAGKARASAPPASAALPPAARTLHDDFGRAVLTQSPDSGAARRSFDAADRLVGMQDAAGHRARYAYDARGRILRQDIVDAASGQSTPTEWRYDKRHLLEVIHPTQSERFEYDARGLQSARIVTLHTPPAPGADAGGDGAIRAITRYEHDADGQLVASTLPDGSRLAYERNGQGQVVALKRQSIQTPWLRWLGSEQTIASGFERDLAGLRRYVSGNGIEARHERSASGELARLRYRHAAPAPQLQARAGSADLPLSRGAHLAIERLLGIAPAHALGLPADPGQGEARQDGPGALGLPHDAQALIDHRYLWSAGGHLLLSQQRAGGPGEQHQRSYAYDRAGRLLASVQASLAAEHGAPAVRQASAPAQQPPAEQPAREQDVWRYAYDARSRRVLSQQTASQADLADGTRRSQYQPASHRLLQGPRTRYSANGQPEQLGERAYAWDTLGRLAEVRQAGALVARYRYDHRGLRIAKETGPRTRHALYDASRQPLAELDAQGRIARQYVWLADLPLAVIDAPDASGTPLAGDDAPALSRIAADLARIAQAWLGRGERIAWLHTNHLGAPEAATDAQARLLWRASYAPFGAATVTAAETPAGSTFALDLRLPGQMFDAETGLHYNRQRYYDPALGQYLTPDPLGTPDGPNPYAYVAFNPLSYVDPDGLVLFAFDGTDNGEPALAGSSLSNVVLFRDMYKDDGSYKYVTGVGTDHAGRDSYGNILTASYSGVMGLVPDKGGNYSGPDRIARMMLYFVDAAETFGEDNKYMDIDIVGFSRGAAQARDFANRLVKMLDKSDPGVLRYQKHDEFGKLSVDSTGKPVMGYQCVNFRFMGLFDTVLSTNRSGTRYDLAIPGDFKYVAQAVALNEYRSAPAGTDAFWTAPSNFRFWDDTRIHLAGDNHYGGFPLQSIGASSNTPGKVRIERGFIGAHSDIGGGYGDDNALSKVALSWMVGQAQIAGVKMDASAVNIEMSNPVHMHDQSNVIRFGDPTKAPASFEIRGRFVGTNTRALEDREVLGGLGGGTQRTQTFGPPEAGGNRSMTNADTHEFISYLPRRPADLVDGTLKNPAYDTRPTNEIPGLQGVPEGTPSNFTGTVNMAEYMGWLRSHGYVFAGDKE